MLFQIYIYLGLTLYMYIAELHLSIEDLILMFYLSNGLYFFGRCSLITATMCAYKLKNAR